MRKEALRDKLIPEALWKRAEEEADSLWKDRISGRWRFAIPVLVLWGILLLLLWRLLL